MLKLHEYQHGTADELYENDVRIAVVPMGGGKTISTLTAIWDMICDDHVAKAIVFAPKLVAMDVWTAENDHKKWPHLKGLKVVSIAGLTPKKRKAILDAGEYDVLVVNYELAPWMEKEGYVITSDMIIAYDELTRVKSHKSQRRKAINKMSPNTTKRWGLTGSPRPNSLLDLWGMADAVQPGIWGPFNQWRATYFRPVDRDGHIWKVLPGVESMIMEAFAEIAFKVDSDQIPMSPTPQLIMHPFDLPRDVMEEYKTLEDEMVYELGDDPLEWITAENSMAHNMKLRQLAAGFIMDAAGEVHEIHGVKQDMIHEIREQAEGEPMLHIYQFKHEVEMLRRRYPDLVNLTGIKDVKPIREAWDRGEIMDMIGHPMSMGHGLNLQHGGHHILWNGLTDSLEGWEQVNARLARQGQTKQVYVHVPVVKGSREPDMVKAIHRKASEQDALKEVLRSVS